jgi:hypothetical protein
LQQNWQNAGKPGQACDQIDGLGRCCDRRGPCRSDLRKQLSHARDTAQGLRRFPDS